jgi:hypothetical protein
MLFKQFVSPQVRGQFVYSLLDKLTSDPFSKALKTGLKAEELQLENADRLFAAISIKSILALRLIDLREKVQLNPEASADESDLSDLELKVLSVYLKRNLVTLRDVSLAIGRLGGHLNRKGDGLPGILTLWKGMTRLNELVVGARMAIEYNLFEKFG